MKCVTWLLYFSGLFSIMNCSLIWSKTYSLKAVLNVPSANISEPYQVWVDQETGNYRIDFYNGTDRIYKIKTDTGYNYYKIYPETTDEFQNAEVCENLNSFDLLLDIYEDDLLPNRNFKLVGKESLNGVDVQKWVHSSKTVDTWNDTTLVVEFIYNMFVSIKKTFDDQYIPLRYEFQVKVNGKEEDYYRHDYTDFNNSEINYDIFYIPKEYYCYNIMNKDDYEPVNPLIDYINPELGHERISKDFERFKLKHSKQYSNKKEHMERLKIFRNNVRYINSMNRQHRSFSLAINHLADRTDAEMSVLFSSHSDERFGTIDYDVDEDENDNNVTNRPNTFDWRNYHAISPIKDQTTMCGSCYAFTVAATVESSIYVSRGCKNLTELSEQALVDCTYKGNGMGNSGCKGGSFVYTLYWIRNHGIPYKSEYGPYLAMEGFCHNKKMRKHSKINNFVRLKKNMEKIKRAILKNGPLVIGINSKPKSFTFYSKGIYDDTNCGSSLFDMSHAITLIGYGEEAGKGYWILKNSYGSNWGESGYMKLAIDSNICGAMNQVFKVEYKNNLVNDCFNQEKK